MNLLVFAPFVQITAIAICIRTIWALNQMRNESRRASRDALRVLWGTRGTDIDTENEARVFRIKHATAGGAK